MNTQRLALLSVLLMSTLIWGQTEQLTTVIESGDIRNVLALSGTVSSSHRLVGNQQEYDFDKSLKGKNISGKPILLVVVAFDCCGSHGWLRWDKFFEKPIQPDEDMTFGDGGEGSTRPVNWSPPEATASVLYVQFADGTSAGDDSKAEESFAFRAAVLKSLRELRAVYAASGEEAFKKALSGTFPPNISFYMQSFRRVAETGGAEDAIATINNTLHFAEVNAAQLPTGK